MISCETIRYMVHYMNNLKSYNNKLFSHCYPNIYSKIV